MLCVYTIFYTCEQDKNQKQKKITLFIYEILYEANNNVMIVSNEQQQMYKIRIKKKRTK